MDIIVTFFRDILDGPLYIIVSIISGILFCSCIGYLAERNNLKKAAKKKFENSYATVNNIDNSIGNNANNLGDTINNIVDSSQSVNIGQDNNNKVG